MFKRERGVTLLEAIEEYRSGNRTSELVTTYWREKLKEIGVSAEVPSCDWTEAEIQKPMINRRGKLIPGMMVPDLEEVTIRLLAKRCPQLRWRVIEEGYPFGETHQARGWLKVYDSVSAPNGNICITGAMEFAQKEGYLPGRLKGYILSGLAMKDFWGKYADEESTMSWLPGMCFKARGGIVEMVNVKFESNGRLTTYPDFGGWEAVPVWYQGFRFEESR